MNGASRSVLPARGHLDAPSYSSSTANVFECLPEMIRRSQTEPLERSAAFWSKASSCKKVSSWSRTSEPMRSHNKGLGPSRAMQVTTHSPGGSAINAAPCRTMPHHAAPCCTIKWYSCIQLCILPVPYRKHYTVHSVPLDFPEQNVPELHCHLLEVPPAKVSWICLNQNYEE